MTRRDEGRQGGVGDDDGRRHFRWAAPLIALALLLAVYGYWIRLSMAENKTQDFSAYLIAAHALDVGGNPYTMTAEEYLRIAEELELPTWGGQFPYPPSTGALVLPFLQFPPRTAALLWLSLNALCLVLGGALLGRSLRYRHGPALAWALMVPFVPPLSGLHNGQVTGLLFLSLCLAVWAFRRGRSGAGGASLMVGACIKVTPIVLVAHLAWRMRLRALAGATAAVLLVVAVTVAVFGVSVWVDFFTAAPIVLSPDIVYVYGSNFSLNGFIGRMLVGPGSGQPDPENRRTAGNLGLGASLLLVLATALLLWPPGRGRRPLLLEFSLIISALQLISSISWYYQMTLLLIPVCAVADAVLTGGARRRLAGPLAAIYLIIGLHGLLSPRLPDCFLVREAPVFAALALWVLVAVALRGAPRGRGESG